jgi:hypothetical protein
LKNRNPGKQVFVPAKIKMIVEYRQKTKPVRPIDGTANILSSLTKASGVILAMFDLPVIVTTTKYSPKEKHHRVFFLAPPLNS